MYLPYLSVISEEKTGMNSVDKYLHYMNLTIIWYSLGTFHDGQMGLGTF